MNKRHQEQTIQHQEAVQTRGDIVYLTPALFRELDELARTEAGVPISVCRHEDMDDFAHVSVMAVGQFDMTGEKPRVMREAGCITLANQIDLRKVRACGRPEMDWSVLNTENVYRFLILHEIAHVRRRDAIFFFETQIHPDFYDRETMMVNPQYRCLSDAIEADADRAAWAALYPNEPMPKRLDPPISPEELNEVLERFRDDRDKYPRRPPISTDPKLYVPYNHVEGGIPWAVPVVANEGAEEVAAMKKCINYIAPENLVTMEINDELMVPDFMPGDYVRGDRSVSVKSENYVFVQKENTLSVMQFIDDQRGRFLLHNMDRLCIEEGFVIVAPVIWRHSTWGLKGGSHCDDRWPHW